MPTRLSRAYSAVADWLDVRHKLKEATVECRRLRRELKRLNQSAATIADDAANTVIELDQERRHAAMLQGRVEVLEKQVDEFAALHQANREMFDAYAATFAAVRTRVSMTVQE